MKFSQYWLISTLFLFIYTVQSQGNFKVVFDEYVGNNASIYICSQELFLFNNYGNQEEVRIYTKIEPDSLSLQHSAEMLNSEYMDWLQNSSRLCVCLDSIDNSTLFYDKNLSLEQIKLSPSEKLLKVLTSESYYIYLTRDTVTWDYKIYHHDRKKIIATMLIPATDLVLDVDFLVLNFFKNTMPEVFLFTHVLDGSEVYTHLKILQLQ